MRRTRHGHPSLDPNMVVQESGEGNDTPGSDWGPHWTKMQSRGVFEVKYGVHRRDMKIEDRMRCRAEGPSPSPPRRPLLHQSLLLAGLPPQPAAAASANLRICY